MELWILNWFVEFGLAKELENLAFENAYWLGLMGLWPLLWLVTVLQARWFDYKDDLSESRHQGELAVKHNLIHLMKQAAFKPEKSRSLLSNALFEVLRGLVIILLAVTLANPVEKMPAPAKPEPKTVRDIVFVIESSASFLLPDYLIDGQPAARMSVVKNVLDSFISKLEGNRFSVTIYAEKAFTMLPMTYDSTLARLTLKRLKPYLAGRTDVAMGEALGLALQQADESLQIQKIAQQSTANTPAKKRKKVVVLISDGLSLPSRLELTEAVNYAQLLQVPIYTIGVGASSKQADKRLYTGLLYQPLESDSLKLIASQTQAQYYEVGSGAEISDVLEKINQAEGVPFIPPPSSPVTKPLYHYSLQLAVLIMFLYWILARFSSAFTFQERRLKHD